MADTTSSLLQLLLMGDGLHDDDWGDQNNANLQKLENAIAATQTIAITSTAQTVTAPQSANAALLITGSLTGDTVLTLPQTAKAWLVLNRATMNGHTLTLTTGLGGNAVFSAYASHIVYSDGANILDVTAENGVALSANTVLANLGSGTAGVTYSQLLEALGINTDQAPTFQGIQLANAAGTGRQINFKTGTAARWGFGADNTAESGGNSGSNLFLDAYQDGGGVIGRALAVVRATLSATWGGALNVIGTLNASLIQQQGSALIPAGAYMNFATSTAPGGWLECNGAAISRTTYAALYAAIGTFYGAGDGSTTFNLPDTRGYFMRGWDDGRGIDSGRTFGSTQADSIVDHTHGEPPAVSGSGAQYLFGQGGAGGPLAGGGTFNYSESTVTGSVSSPSGGGTETRPKNLAVLICIKT